jgi:predicted DNA binding CopG/RHH family protein
VEGKYIPVSKKEFKRISKALAARRKDAVLNIRVNSEDLRQIKRKADRLGVKYQSFLSEFIHQIAQS